MQRYDFSNSNKIISIKDFIELLSNKKDICQFIWDNKDLLGESAFNITRANSLEELESKWEKRLYKAADFLLNVINNAGSKLHLYRAIILEEGEEADLECPGTCWTPAKEYALDFVDSILDEDLELDFDACIIESDVDFEDVDWVLSLCLNAIEPGEKEIRVFKNASFHDIKRVILK